MIEKFLIGTYTKKTSQGVYQIELDTTTEKLQNSELVLEAGSPTYVAESKNKIVYAVDKDTSSEKTMGGILVADGKKEPFNKIQLDLEEGSAAAYVSVDEKRNLLYTANYHTADVIVYKIESDGKLTEVDRVHDDGKVGPKEEQQNGAHPHYADITYDGRLAVADLGLDKLYLYDLDESGKLTLVSEYTTHPGFGPRHINFVPSKGIAYLVGELSSEVEVLDYNEESGELTTKQIISTIPEDWNEHNGSAAIRISNDENYIYVSNRGNNSIAVFKADKDGKLTLIQRISTEGEFPRDFHFNSNEKYLIVANQNTDNVSLFSRNETSGKLSLLQKDFKVPEGTCVEIRK
ncbi:beta-propeller fold lactonase family protein [Lactobacillus sp. S2-2]|uniref:lactonase family protein n=1 Tax=Lactobacillus sp. S2-2 TaxID=2692917 RepID=UPI001F2FEDF0|nr:lactonase family protein [Lactobacillus sp. S2-2]MCF6515723.1 beta-propeller fold lactonase family protein [Lactobacillus sp. S2-2]